MTRKEQIDKEANSFANTISIGEQEIAKNWSAFVLGAEWADRTMIEKVCEWLKENAPKYHWYDPVEDDEGVRWNDMVEDLRKAMEK